MSTQFPAALDTYTNPASSDLLSSATVPHAAVHTNAYDAIKAIEAKLGIVASTPITNSVLTGTGAGNSSWSASPTLTSLGLGGAAGGVLKIYSTNGVTIWQNDATAAFSNVSLQNAAGNADGGLDIGGYSTAVYGKIFPGGGLYWGQTAVDPGSNNVRVQGNLGVGAALIAGSGQLTVNGGIDLGGANRSIRNVNNNSLAFGTNNLDRFTINADGSGTYSGGNFSFTAASATVTGATTTTPFYLIGARTSAGLGIAIQTYDNVAVLQSRIQINGGQALGSGLVAIGDPVTVSQGPLTVSAGGAAITGATTINSADNVATTNIVSILSANATLGVGFGYQFVRTIGSNANSDLFLDAKGTAAVKVGYGNPANTGGFIVTAGSGVVPIAVNVVGGAYGITLSGQSSSNGLRIFSGSAVSNIVLSLEKFDGTLIFQAKGDGSTIFNTTAGTAFNGKITTYNSVATAGWGVPSIVASARSTAQTGAVASVASYTCGAADGSFEIGGNILVTAYTAGTISIVVTYTDESNTARSLTMPLSSLAGAIVTVANSASAYEALVLQIRVKASTAITITTTVAAANFTYNVEGTIKQIA